MRPLARTVSICLALSSLAPACSWNYDPDDLRTGAALADGGRAIDAAPRGDATSSPDATPGADGGDRDPDAGHGSIDASLFDAAQGPADAAPGPRDAAPDPPDAAPGPPDAAPPCGSTGDQCCPTQPRCTDAYTECTGGTCAACGGTLQSCCDTGPQCRGLLNCVAGLCVL